MSRPCSRRVAMTMIQVDVLTRLSLLEAVCSRKCLVARPRIQKVCTKIPRLLNRSSVVHWT
jgi:hypothetical protein